MHEVITLQLGPLSNHTATHFWNAQCVDSRQSLSQVQVLFRESPTLGPLPRTVIVDFGHAMGAVGSLPDDDNKDQDPITTWPASQVDKITSLPSSAQSQSQSQSQSQYHQLLNQTTTQSTHLDPNRIRAWADYLHPYLDPLSPCPLPSSSPQPLAPVQFSHPQSGHDLLSWEWLQDTLLDTHLRHFLEDADHPQGLHVLADTYAAWAGISRRVLIDGVADSLPKLPLLVHSLASDADPRALAHVVGGLVDAGMADHGLVHNVIKVPKALAAHDVGAGDLYLGMAQVAPLVDLTLAPVRAGTWRLAHLTGLLGDAVPGCPLVHARMYMPGLTAAVQRRGVAVFPPNTAGWIDFGGPRTVAAGERPRPDAELWMSTALSSASVPKYVQRTARAVQWTKVDEPSVTYPRIMPYPYTADQDEQEANEDGDTLVVHYEAGAKTMQDTVQCMAGTVKRTDPELYETLVGMVEHATDGEVE